MRGTGIYTTYIPRMESMSSRVHTNRQPIPHAKHYRTVDHGRILLLHRKLELVYQTGRYELQLSESQFLAKTDARAGLEDGKLEGTLGHKDAVLQPPLWLELSAIRTPDGFHSTHGVDVVRDAVAFDYHSAVRKNIISDCFLCIKRYRREETEGFVDSGGQIVQLLQLSE